MKILAGRPFIVITVGFDISRASVFSLSALRTNWKALVPKTTESARAVPVTFDTTSEMLSVSAKSLIRSLVWLFVLLELLPLDDELFC